MSCAECTGARLSTALTSTTILSSTMQSIFEAVANGYAAIDNRYRLLRFNAESRLPHFDSQAHVIDRFEQAGTEDTMNPDPAPVDLLGQRVQAAWILEH